MGEFGWAYVSGSQIPDGIEGSVQYKGGEQITGSTNLVFDNASNTLVLSGTLNVSGAINANELNINVTNKSVTNISMTGSTNFGDSDEDQHRFYGTTTLTGASDSALIYQVTASVWAHLDPSHTGSVPNPSPAQYFYLTSSNSIHRGILNYTWGNGEGSGSVSDAATFVRAVNPALVVSGAVIFNDPISVQGGLYGASPIDIYAPLVFCRDDLTEASPDDVMKIEQGKFRGNVIISSSNDNHGLWMEGAGYIVMNSKKTLSTNERAPEFVQNNRTSDRGSYPSMYQRVFQAVPVSENPLFLNRRHSTSRHNIGEMRWTTEFPILTGSVSSSADQYAREDRNIARLLVSTDPRRNAHNLAIQTLDSNMDSEYEALDAINSSDRDLSGSAKPIISPTSPLYDAATQNYSSSLSNIMLLGGNPNPGQGNIYGLKRSATIFGNLFPGGWTGGQNAGFANNFLAKDCTIGHPVARWGDFYIHDDRYLRWGQPAGGGSYKNLYNSNPLTASARIDSGSVTLGYNPSSAFLEVSGAPAYLNDGLNITGSGYINFGTTTGSTGIGFRDNAGTVQFKHTSGEWTNIGSGEIGAAEDVGGYADGLYTDFTTETLVGVPVDRFNEVLKILAPDAAPDLSRIDYTNTVGSNAKLSFDSTSTITDYFNSATAAGFNAIAQDVLYESETSGSNFRLGIYNGAQDILGALNFNVVASTVNGNIEYSADSFGNAETGSLKLELNGVVVHTVDLAVFASGNSLLGSTRSGFTTLSVTSSTYDGNGAEWYIFKYRTADYKIDTLDQRLGWNYSRIIHSVGSENYATNYVEWVNDSDGAASALSVANPRIDEVSLVGSKYVSGVQYNTDLTAKYKVDINNMYRNVYPDGNIISFNATNAGVITAQDLDPIGASENETKIAKVTGSVNNNQNYLLNGTITVSLNATHPLKSNLSSAGSVSITGMLIDNDSSGGNSNLVETFIDEDFRITSGSYDTQGSVVAGAATWNSQNHMTASGATGHEDGMIFYNRRLYNPRDADVANTGNFTGLANVSAGQPDYSSITGTRTFYRKIQNDSGATIRDMKITSQKNGFKFMDDDTGLDNNDSHFFVKIPDSTGWMNIRESFVFGSTSDFDGALIANASDNSSVAGTGDSVNCVSFGTQSVADDDYVVVKIETNHQMAGYVSQLSFQLGASDVSAPTESDLLDDINLGNDTGETAKLSFGTSNGVSGYINVAGGVGSMGAINSNAVYTDNSDTNRGIFKTIEVMGGTLNEDVDQSQAGSFLNYTAKSFKNAHTGSLLLIVNDATASTLSLSNLTSNNNLSSDTGFSVGAVDYSTTTDGIPDYIKSYRTGTFSIGTGQQRSGWNYARVLHRIGGTDTPTNYVQWVIDTSGAVDNTTVTAPTLSNFGHTDIYYQSGIKYYASNPTASFDFEASNFYSNVCATGSNAISFPITTNCQVTNIRAVGTGITTFDSGVSQTGMPALNNSADCETTSIQVTGTIQYNGATPSIYGSLSTFTDQDVAVNAEVLHPLKTDRTTSTANKANLMVYSGSIGNTNLNTEEHFNTETYRIVSGNYANQAAVINSENTWNSQTEIDNGGTHDDGMVTAGGYALSPFKIGVSGDTGHVSLQAPAGNPDYSSLANNIRTFYRYFRYTGVSTVGTFSMTLKGDATLVAKTGTYSGALGASKNIHVEFKVPYDPNYTGGDDNSTAWADCAKIFSSDDQPTNEGAGIRSGETTGEDQAIDSPSGLELSLDLQYSRIKQNQYFVVKISAHKDWTGYLSQTTIDYS